MIDVNSKYSTLRYAKAEGSITAGKDILDMIRKNEIPKGDVLATARAAGISASKKTSDLIVFCHPIPLDWIDITFEFEETKLKVFCETKSVWKTGVEMEAVTGVTASLLNIYDMLKPLNPDLEFGGIKVVEKRGGKSDFTTETISKIKAAVLVISDSTFSGKRTDSSGQFIKEFLEKRNIRIPVFEVLPDDPEKIEQKITSLIDKNEIDLIFTTGGTGLGPKDFTPETVEKIIDKRIPGIEEVIRKFGSERTPFAMLSRQVAGLKKNTVIVTLPGSTRGVEECLTAIFPGILHAFPMMQGKNHDEKATGIK